PQGKFLVGADADLLAFRLLKVREQRDVGNAKNCKPTIQRGKRRQQKSKKLVLCKNVSLPVNSFAKHGTFYIKINRVILIGRNRPVKQTRSAASPKNGFFCGRSVFANAGKWSY
ncbi:MAG: hypothetical protein ACREDS_13860, partial [Limisphaerales bacterium]